MSVLEDIENRVNELSNSAVQKTKQASEIMSLKTCINEEEKRIKTVYHQIGELYYSKKSEAINEMNQLCQSIDDGKEKISQWKKEILVIKKVVECPSCGHENPDTASFCLKCGTKLINPVADGKHCTNCGAPIMEGQLFCIRCGTKVQIVEDIVEEQTRVKEPVNDVEEKIRDEEPVYDETVEEKSIEETMIPEVVDIKEEEPEVEVEPIEKLNVVEEVEQQKETPVIEKEIPQKMSCPTCGKEVKPGQSFCTGCGTNLKDLNHRVEKTEEVKVEEVKKEKVCPSCHTPVKEGQKFCVVCGERLDVAPKKVEIKKRVCPSCGLEIDGLKNKCDICGANLDEPVSNTQKCPKCGKEVKPGQLFCTGCGTKLS